MGKKVDGAYESLIQGVSQQAPIDRVPGQCELLENFSCDPEKGLIRRQPTEFKDALISIGSTPATWYNLLLNNEETLLAVQGSKAYAGVIDRTKRATSMQTVQLVGSAKQYITAPGSLEVLSVDDRVYITNTSVKTAMLPDKKEYVQGSGLIFLLGGQYGRTYKVTVKADDKTFVGTYVTPDGSQAVHINNLSTEYIAEQLVNSLNATTSSVNVLKRLKVGDVYATVGKFSGYCTRDVEVEKFIGLRVCGDAKDIYSDVKVSASSSQPAFFFGNSALIYVTIKETIKDWGGSTTTDCVSTVSTRTRYEWMLINNVTQSTVAGTHPAIRGTLGGNPDYPSGVVGSYTVVPEMKSGGLFMDWFEVQRASDVILLTPKSVVNKLDIAVDDGDGGANIFSLTDTVGDVGKLPRYAPNGYLVRVEGAAGEAADDYYLEFNQSDPGFGNEGYWIECVSPDVEYKFDLATMPHQLVLEDGQYKIEPVEWQERQVGDDDTNPVPSFIGYPINDIAMFQGRLVFLADCNVIMSRTNKYTDFWANSATTLLDSDPIDISSASARSTPIFRYAIPHNRDLVIFSEFAQFIVFGRNALTPANTSLVLTTTYEAELGTTPVAAGKNVFYPINYGRFTGIKEFYTEGNVDINASRPITAHCTQYLEGKVRMLTTSTTFDLLLVQTQTSKRKLYAYEYVWMGDEKAQSAWSTWTFPWDIDHIFFMENEVMFVYQLGGKYHLGRMDLARVDDTEFYQVNLDSKAYIENVATSATLPYTHSEMKFIQGDGCPNPGLEAKVLEVNGTTVTFARDMQGGTIIIGIPYMSRFIPTKPIIRDQNGTPIGTGRLTVFNYRLTCTDTGAFEAVVSSPWHEDAITYFSGRFMNSTFNRVGLPALESGVYDIPFLNDVDNATLEIRSDSPTPLRINRLEWRGNYIKKGARL